MYTWLTENCVYICILCVPLGKVVFLADGHFIFVSLQLAWVNKFSITFSLLLLHQRKNLVTALNKGFEMTVLPTLALQLEMQTVSGQC